MLQILTDRLYRAFIPENIRLIRAFRVLFGSLFFQHWADNFTLMGDGGI